jgi:hypothetical protein
MKKTHYKIYGNDNRAQGQSEFEYSHQTACGYVRENVTTNCSDVDCKWCLKSIHMINYLAQISTRSAAENEKQESL